MFHVEHLERAIEYAGLELDEKQRAQLDSYRDWLIFEAVPAGGIGPNEVDRVETRHIADSLLFAGFLEDAEEVWDLGSGVGLPGIPLAIALPHTRFVLVDRSGRRADLARRAIRILGLENTIVRQAAIEDLQGEVGAIVARASLPPEAMAPIVQRLLRSDGIAVVGGSWTEAPLIEGWEIIEVPRLVLDRPVWILMMRKP